MPVTAAALDAQEAHAISVKRSISNEDVMARVKRFRDGLSSVSEDPQKKILKNIDHSANNPNQFHQRPCRQDLSALARLITESDSGTPSISGAGQAAKSLCTRDKISVKKARPCYRYGNYNNYYGYRMMQDLKDDPRLGVLRPEWFTGKRVMDIGCNEGLVTLRVVARFLCASMVGVDIDASLIRKAIRTLCSAREEMGEWARSGKCTPSAIHNWKGKMLRWTPKLALTSFRNIVFRAENFVAVERQEEAVVDVIMCLSVSKWIHLNWGDEGLRALFAKSFRMLSPGGIFLLEPQPWKSYQQAFNKQSMPVELKGMLQQLSIQPNDFARILMDEIGFISVDKLAPPERSSKGFNRPLLICRKAPVPT